MKQHKTINLLFCQYFSFQTVNLPFQTVNLSFQLFYRQFQTLKMIKTPINLSFVIVFHGNIQHKTTNLSLYVVFVLIKLPQHEIPKNNYRLNDTINFLLLCCIVSCRLSKKVLPQTLRAQHLATLLEYNNYNFNKMEIHILDHQKRRQSGGLNPLCIAKEKFYVEQGMIIPLHM